MSDELVSLYGANPKACYLFQKIIFSGTIGFDSVEVPDFTISVTDRVKERCLRSEP